MLCKLIGIGVEDGSGRKGCHMGPGALRTAGLEESLTELGHEVIDMGDIMRIHAEPLRHPNGAIKKLPEVVAWVSTITETAYRESAEGTLIFMGGDHILSAGTVAGVSRRASEQGRPLFVLWLDAHSDFHTLDSTSSGNLHGTPVAYFTGRDSFSNYFPPLQAPVNPENICMFGIRSVDGPEREALKQTGITVHDMRQIDEHGVAALISAFLHRVTQENGILHVSLDVDFLEPAIAPAVGTTVPGGATFREAHLIMEMLSESGLVSSIDLVELNPFLDERGKTATLLVDLTASLLGKRVMDRPTRSF